MAIPNQDSIEPTSSTKRTAVTTETANQTGELTGYLTFDVTAEWSILLTLDSDLLQAQPNLGLDYALAVTVKRSQSKMQD